MSKMSRVNSGDLHNQHPGLVPCSPPLVMQLESSGFSISSLQLEVFRALVSWFQHLPVLAGGHIISHVLILLKGAFWKTEGEFTGETALIDCLSHSSQSHREVKNGDVEPPSTPLL